MTRELTESITRALKIYEQSKSLFTQRKWLTPIYSAVWLLSLHLCYTLTHGHCFIVSRGPPLLFLLHGNAEIIVVPQWPPTSISRAGSRPQRLTERECGSLSHWRDSPTQPVVWVSDSFTIAVMLHQSSQLKQVPSYTSLIRKANLLVSWMAWVCACVDACVHVCPFKILFRFLYVLSMLIGGNCQPPDCQTLLWRNSTGWTKPWWAVPEPEQTSLVGSCLFSICSWTGNRTRFIFKKF